jgi:hypothetical protein
MEARRPVWKWMAAAFCAALALAIGAMSVALVTQHRLRIGPGLEVTARFAFLLLAGIRRGALRSLFGDAFLPLRTQAGARPLLRRGDCRSSGACGDHLLGWTSASLDDLHHLWRRGVLHVFACASVGPARAGGSASQCLAAPPLCRDELHSLRLHSGFFQISNLRPHRRRQISSFPRARDLRPNIEARCIGADRVALESCSTT